MTMSFRILGPVRLCIKGVPDDAAPPTGPPKQRSLLALLLLADGGFVSIDAIAESLWDGEPPRSALSNIRTYASHVRTMVHCDGSQRLLTAPQGYALRRLDGDELDLDRFRSAVQRGRSALDEGEASRAAAQFERALDTWRGPAGADLNATGPLARRLEALEQEHLSALEASMELRLRLGGLAEAHDDLRALTLAHPLRERLWVSFMFARYHLGDVPGALAIYREARAVFLDELGVEPGAALVDAHRAILNRDSGLETPPRPLRGQSRDRARRPRELPAAVGRLVGRDTELQALVRTVGRALHPLPGGPCVLAVHGAAGVGTSALALRTAAAVREQFPDGHLYVDIGAVADSISPAELPLYVLMRLLRSLGAAGGTEPFEADDAAARFRSVVAPLRVLAVLDNVTETSQVEKLIPAGDRCAVIVVGTESLELFDPATYRLRVRPLSTVKSMELLTALLEPSQSVPAREELRKLAEQSGGSPRRIRALASGMTGRRALVAAEVRARA